MRILVLSLAVVLAGCAATSLRSEVYANPVAAFDAAKIAEGAYLASPRATPEGLAHLIELDRAATAALRAYRQRPSPEQAQQAQLAIADLADYLSTGARL